jgi:hypothetical protein
VQAYEAGRYDMKIRARRSKYLYKDLKDFETYSARFDKVNKDFRDGWNLGRLTQKQAGVTQKQAIKIPMVYWCIVLPTIVCGAISALYFIWKD